MGKITYTRGTSYAQTYTYTAPTYFGSMLFFTVKNEQFDSDATDTTNSILTPKSIPMTGSTFPQTVVVNIAPTDIADTVVPGTYYYSAKVKDTNGGEYVIDSGQFVLVGVSTNRT
jgi:hypothetical protein